MDDLVISSRIVIPAKDLTWNAARSSGPGGQNVNKVSSKVELRFDVEGTDALSSIVKTRLRALAKNRLDRDGKLLVTSQTHRDQPRNLEDARQKVADLVRQALVVPKKRRKTKPSKAAKQRRLDDKKKTAQRKDGRRRVDY
ncbi:MAG: alternative ribosome rescue aminoacyl-tRNA hydrolase ArfB [Sandaracinaceae bacterium]